MKKLFVLVILSFAILGQQAQASFGDYYFASLSNANHKKIADAINAMGEKLSGCTLVMIVPSSEAGAQVRLTCGDQEIFFLQSTTGDLGLQLTSSFVIKLLGDKSIQLKSCSEVQENYWPQICYFQKN